jgi:hypothetical protein
MPIAEAFSRDDELRPHGIKRRVHCCMIDAVTVYKK